MWCCHQACFQTEDREEPPELPCVLLLLLLQLLLLSRKSRVDVSVFLQRQSGGAAECSKGIIRRKLNCTSCSVLCGRRSWCLLLSFHPVLLTDTDRVNIMFPQTLVCLRTACEVSSMFVTTMLLDLDKFPIPAPRTGDTHVSSH